MGLSAVRSVLRNRQPVACLRSVQPPRAPRGKPHEIVANYRRFTAMVRANGPVLVVPEKTRIAFQVRMSFAVVTLHRRWLDGHVVLARRFSHPSFRWIQTISPHNHVHTFRIASEGELDGLSRAGCARPTPLANSYISAGARITRSSAASPKTARWPASHQCCCT